MVFSTTTFLFLFFPITLMLYYAMPNLKAKNCALLIMSLLFYAWGEPVFVLLMMLTAFVNYICARLLHGSKHHKKAWLTVSIVFSLGALGLFKYAGFFLENLNHLPFLSLPGWKLALPIGISFYTFQALSYTIDVYRGEARMQRSYADFLLYVSLFPQLIAGPIVRYVDVQNEISYRTITAEEFMTGITRFLVGLSKKLLLADYCGMAADMLLKGTQQFDAAGAAEIILDPSILGGWLGIILYAFQIYFDFSGYSDMAIGLGKMLGFHFKENFDYPYICTSITDFWRRWHISLSSWFRDYVYIPLGGSRCSKARNIFNLFVVWFLTGFWHGASWNFILWGLYYFVLLVLEKFVFRRFVAKGPLFLRRILSLFFVLMGWALFYFDDLDALWAFFRRIFGMAGGPLTSTVSLTQLENYVLLLAVCVIASLPLGRWIRRLFTGLQDAGGSLTGFAMGCRLLANTVMLAACVLVMINNSYDAFLYFRF